jgi:S1-C subfamily serine protease
MIKRVARNSIAEQAGLRQGEVILSANQHDVKNPESFKRLVQRSNGSLLLLVYGARGPRFIVLSK